MPATDTFADGEALATIRTSILNERATMLLDHDTKLAGIEAGATADQSAAEVPYSNGTSGLAATDVQAAIDEIVAGAAAVGVTSVNGIGPGDIDVNAADIPFDGPGNGMAAENVEDGIIEANAAALSMPAAGQIEYDNDGKTISATETQGALDEIETRLIAQEGLPLGGVQSVAGKTNAVTLDAVDSAYDNATSGLAATDVQAAIDELVSQGIQELVQASNIPYDNGTSGLTAIHVQDAIDEVHAAGGGAASGTTYDNATSGLTATDVQAAIDELDAFDDNLDGTQVGYDNTSTAIPAGEVQTALDFVWTAFAAFGLTYKQRVLGAYTANHTLLASEDGAIMGCTSGTDVTLTIPTAASSTSRIVEVKRVDAFPAQKVIVVVSGGGFIDDAGGGIGTQLDLTSPGDAVRLYSDGLFWWILG